MPVDTSMWRTDDFFFLKQEAEEIFRHFLVVVVDSSKLYQRK